MRKKKGQVFTAARYNHHSDCFLPAAHLSGPAGDPLILFCTSDSRKTPLPIHPTYGTSDMQNKSGFCAINGNCLMEEHMVKKKKKCY